tara:strand:+ start:1999 stop:2661 length:663 start_codon:yes stop_codon:yes gene_type:complete
MAPRLAPLAALFLLACGRAGEPGPSTGGPSGNRPVEPVPVVGLPCEGCDTVFVGMPAAPGPETRVAAATEPGEALTIRGTVRDAGGRAVSGIVVYVYHTDAEGLYPRDEVHRTRHGRLRAWARTDELGRYTFHTVRPGSYPGTDEPQHVHMHVIEPGRCTYYIDDLLFDDDPLLTPARRAALTGRAGSGVAVPTRDDRGVWQAGRDIMLGRNIPGYPPRP